MADVSAQNWNRLMRYVTRHETDLTKKNNLIFWMLDTQSQLAERAHAPAAISLPIPALPAIQQAAPEHKSLPFLSGPLHPSLPHAAMVSLMQDMSPSNKEAQASVRRERVPAACVGW